MAIDRRSFLGTLALAPAVLGCAGAPRAGGASAAAAGAGAPPAAPSPGLAALRAFPLPASAEPAFVFRAAPARPGEP